MEKTVSYWSRASHIIYLAQEIINNCHLISEFVDELENAIMFAALNVVHNSLLSLEDLQAILHELNKMYPENRLVKLQNLQSYYELFGVKVTFKDNYVIFTIHVPILQPDSFTSYHLYPIPINNQTIIPVKPILVLSTTDYILRTEVCPQIESLFICQGEIRPNLQECIPQMLLKNQPSYCKPTPLMLTMPIIEQISQNHVLVLTSKSLDVRLQCDENGLTRITKPTLFTIPKGCTVHVNGLTFSMDQSYINGSLFLLPAIESIPDLPQVDTKPLVLQRITLDEIHDLQNTMNHLQPLRIDDYPNAISNTTLNIIIALSIGCCCLLMIIFRKQIAERCSRCRFLKKTNQAPSDGSELRSTHTDPF